MATATLDAEQKQNQKGHNSFWVRITHKQIITLIFKLIEKIFFSFKRFGFLDDPDLQKSIAHFLIDDY